MKGSLAPRHVCIAQHGRKVHLCAHCEQQIKPGEQMVRIGHSYQTKRLYYRCFTKWLSK